MAHRLLLVAGGVLIRPDRFPGAVLLQRWRSLVPAVRIYDSLVRKRTVERLPDRVARSQRARRHGLKPDRGGARRDGVVRASSSAVLGEACGLSPGVLAARHPL